MRIESKRVTSNNGNNAHRLTDKIKRLALSEVTCFKESTDLKNGFRGAKYPLSVDGWYIHLDNKGTLRQITYEKNGTKVHYTP